MLDDADRQAQIASDGRVTSEQSERTAGVSCRHSRPIKLNDDGDRNSSEGYLKVSLNANQ